MSAIPDVEVYRPRPRAVVVECKGEHDLATHDQMERLLADLVEANDLVVIDVTEAEFIDSSFIHNLVKVDGAARSHGARVRLQYSTAPIVARALELSGILARIEHAATREDALATGPEPH
jgi:anti-anti-sigma factor